MYSGKDIYDLLSTSKIENMLSDVNNIEESARRVLEERTELAMYVAENIAKIYEKYVYLKQISNIWLDDKRENVKQFDNLNI